MNLDLWLDSLAVYNCIKTQINDKTKRNSWVKWSELVYRPITSLKSNLKKQ